MDWTLFLIGLGIFFLIIFAIALEFTKWFITERHRQAQELARIRQEIPHTTDIQGQPLDAHEYGYLYPMEQQHQEKQGSE